MYTSLCHVHVMDQASAREEEDEQVSHLATLTSLHSSFEPHLVEVSASVQQLHRELAPLNVQAPQLTA